MDVIAPRHRSLGVSVFSRISQLAVEHDAINLAQGFPDFDPPPQLVAAAEDALRRGINQYAPSVGLGRLREAIARQSAVQHGVAYDPALEVTVTAGATEGIWSTITALMSPGDEAVILEPFYELYPACVAAAGGTARFVTSGFPDFRLDIEEVEAAFSQRTRILVLNTPANPSGRQLNRAELVALGRIAERHDAFIVSDEAYEHILLTHADHLPVASVPQCRERTVTVSSISKTFSATGWRIGWTLAPPALTDAIRRIHQFVVFAAPSPLQEAAAAMFEAAEGSTYYGELQRDYRKRRVALASSLQRMGLEVCDPEGTYFLIARVDGDEVAYCEHLIKDVGVGAIPASSFFDSPEAGRGLVRFAFCKRLETLIEAGERLERGSVLAPAR